MKTLAATAGPALSAWREYLALTKPGVVLLIVFTALVGMLLAVPGWPPLVPTLAGTAGIALAAGGAAAINHLLDRRIDARMSRTRHRPLPRGTVSERATIAFATTLSVASMVILVFGTNLLTAVLTFASLIGYAILYTAWLKRATPQNIVIGGAAGAAPPVLGWTAVTGTISPDALLLFLIIFAWTPPHFWALAIHRRDEYARVDIPMLPVTHGIRFTRWQILFYTVLLTVVTILPFLSGMSGPLYLAGALVLDIGFLWYALRLLEGGDERVPMKTFSYSITYLMVLFAFLIADHWFMLLVGQT